MEMRVGCRRGCRAHLDAELPQAALQLLLRQGPRSRVQAAEHCRVGGAAGAVVLLTELLLLLRRPEVADQELPWEEVPEGGGKEGRRGQEGQGE